MNKILLITLLLSSFLFIPANIQASDIFPPEFKQLIESYKNSNLNLNERNQFNKLVLSIEDSAKSIDPTQVIILIKEEIAKGILSFQLENSLSISENIGLNSIKIINEKIMNNSEGYDSFCLWFISSLQSDIWDISTNKLKINKYSKMLSPWLSYFLQANPQDFLKTINNLQLAILIKVSIKLSLLKHFSSPGLPLQNDMNSNNFSNLTPDSPFPTKNPDEEIPKALDGLPSTQPPPVSSSTPSWLPKD